MTVDRTEMCLCYDCRFVADTAMRLMVASYVQKGITLNVVEATEKAQDLWDELHKRQWGPCKEQHD